MKKSAKRIVSAILSLCMVSGAFGSVSGKPSENEVSAYTVNDTHYNKANYRSGLFESGAAWKYCRENRRIVISGAGSFTEDELKKITDEYETDCVVICETTSVPDGFDYSRSEYKVFVLTEGMTPDDITYVKEDDLMEGTFAGGGEWHYKRSNRCLIVDGEGTFDREEFLDVFETVTISEIDIVVFGKDIIYPERTGEYIVTGKELRYDSVIETVTGIPEHMRGVLTFTYKGSSFEQAFEKYLNDYADAYDRTVDYYRGKFYDLSILPDDADPFTYEYEKWDDYNKNNHASDEDGTFSDGVKWHYDSELMGLMVYGNGTVGTDEFGLISDKFKPQYAVIGKNVKIDEEKSSQGLNLFCLYYTNCTVDNWYPLVYSYEGSDIQAKYEEFTDSMVERFIEKPDVAESYKQNGLRHFLGIVSNDISGDFAASAVSTNEVNTRLYRLEANNLSEGETGDINKDGKVDVTDLSNLSLYLIGDKTFDYDCRISADVDRDGKAELSDLARMRQYISKMIASFG